MNRSETKSDAWEGWALALLIVFGVWYAASLG